MFCLSTDYLRSQLLRFSPHREEVLEEEKKDPPRSSLLLLLEESRLDRFRQIGKELPRRLHLLNLKRSGEPLLKEHDLVPGRLNWNGAVGNLTALHLSLGRSVRRALLPLQDSLATGAHPRTRNHVKLVKLRRRRNNIAKDADDERRFQTPGCVRELGVSRLRRRRALVWFRRSSAAMLPRLCG